MVCVKCRLRTRGKMQTADFLSKMVLGFSLLRANCEHRLA